MPNFKIGKIYIIKCKNDDNLIYVGSTCKHFLSDRMGCHRSNKKKNPTTMFYSMVEDWNDWFIQLYENYPCDCNVDVCNNKECENRLRKREGEVIDLIGNLNKKKAGVNSHTYEYKNQPHKKEQKSNKGKELVECDICGLKITRYKLKRHKTTSNCRTPEQMDIFLKEKAERKEVQRNKNNIYYSNRYYEKHDEILQKQKDKRNANGRYICECGGNVCNTPNLIKRHFETDKHKHFINTNK